MKIIFNTLTGETSPYPRADDEPVIGLAGHLVALVVVADPQPDYDAVTHRLKSSTARVGDTWRTTWQVVAIESELLEEIPSITKSQLRLWLAKNEITELVEAAIQKLDESQRLMAQIRWECTAIYERNHPLVAAIGELLNMKPADLDNLFKEAALL